MSDEWKPKAGETWFDVRNRILELMQLDVAVTALRRAAELSRSIRRLRNYSIARAAMRLALMDLNCDGLKKENTHHVPSPLAWGEPGLN